VPGGNCSDVEVIDCMFVQRIIAKIERFQRLVLLLIIGVIPLVVDPDTIASFVDTKFLMLQLLILMLLVSSGVKLCLGGFPSRIPLIAIPLLLMIGVFFAHVLTDPYPAYARIRALKFSGFFLLPLFFLSAFKTRRHRDSAEVFLVLMTVPMLIYALFQYLNLELFEYLVEMEKSKVQGTLGNSHFLGGYLAMLSFLILNRAIQAKRSREQMAYVFTLIIVLFVLIVARSRGAMLCVAAAVFGFVGVRALVGVYQRRNRAWKWVLAGWLSVGVLVPVVFWAGGRRGAENPIHEVEMRIQRDRSLNNRAVLALISLRMWGKHPVWGVGVDRFPLEYFPVLFEFAADPHFHVFKTMALDMESTQANEAHNDFLQYLAELGIVGYGLLVWLCCLVLWGLGKLVCDRGVEADVRDRRLVSCLIPALLTAIAQMLYSFPLHLPSNSVLVFLILGWPVLLFRRYGVLEFQLPRWGNFRVGRWILALALAAYSGWGAVTVLRQYVGLVYMRIGFLLLSEYKNPEGAAKPLQEASYGFPENGEINLYQAQALFSFPDQRHKALAKLDEAGRSFSNSSLRLARSQVLMELYRFSEALEELEPLFLISRRLTRLHMARGMIYYHEGQYEKAIEDYQAELEIDSTNSQALVYLAQSYFNLGNYYQAERLFRKVYNENIRGVDICERLGDIYAEHRFGPRKAKLYYYEALNWAVKDSSTKDIRRVEKKINDLERKIRLKMENPLFRARMRDRQ